MARVSFSALVEEFVGKLAGSVFQDSYQGYQIRTRVSPRNRQSYRQQLRRGEFAYISALWRTMSSTQRQSFIDAASSPSGGFNLFVSCNINASLIGVSLINLFVATTVPPQLPIKIDELSPDVFTFSASGTITTVPAGQTLIIFATAERGVSQIFTNPSMYQPISFFPSGTILSSPIDIGPNWIEHYGQFRSGFRICIKSVLIENSNGLRSADFIVCANETTPSINEIIDFDSTVLIDSDNTTISFP